MNKAELIDAIANTADLSKMNANRAVDALIAAITNALKFRRHCYINGAWHFLCP